MMSGATVTGAGIPANSIVAFLGQAHHRDDHPVLSRHHRDRQHGRAHARHDHSRPGHHGELHDRLGGQQEPDHPDPATRSTAAAGRQPRGRHTDDVHARLQVRRLSHATATASAATLTIQNPGYMPLPASDNGLLRRQQLRLVEQLRHRAAIDTPHGMRTYDRRPHVGLTVPPSNTIDYQTGYNSGWAVPGTMVSGSPVVTGSTNAKNYQAGSAVYLNNFTATGTLAASSAVVTGLSGRTLAVGLAVSGAGVPSGTTIASIQSSSQVTLSAAATATGAESLTFPSPTRVGPSPMTRRPSPGSPARAARVGMGVFGRRPVRDEHRVDRHRHHDHPDERVRAAERASYSRMSRTGPPSSRSSPPPSSRCRQRPVLGPGLDDRDGVCPGLGRRHRRLGHRAVHGRDSPLHRFRLLAAPGRRRPDRRRPGILARLGGVPLRMGPDGWSRAAQPGGDRALRVRRGDDTATPGDGPLGQHPVRRVGRPRGCDRGQGRRPDREREPGLPRIRQREVERRLPEPPLSLQRLDAHELRGVGTLLGHVPAPTEPQAGCRPRARPSAATFTTCSRPHGRMPASRRR